MAKEKTYRIGDACKQLEIQAYVLRYWETEFPPLSPDKSQAGQRLYTETDLAVIRRIKELLYDEGYTIAGARKKLESELESGGPATAKREKRPAPERKTASKTASARKATKKAAPPEDSSDLERLQRTHRELRKGVEQTLAEARSLLKSLAG